MRLNYRGTINALALCSMWLTAAGAQFPLTDSTSKLDQEAIDAALVEARENDIDVTMQNALLYKGLMLFQEEEFEQSIPFLEEALRMDPSLTAGFEALGWAYIKTGKPQRGYELWEYFQQLMPDNWMPYNLLAQAAVMNRDWLKADEMFRKALAINPDLFDQKYWFGQNLLRIGKIDEGEAVFRELIAREPGRLDVQIDLANLISHKFEFDEATQIWRYINTELPGNPKFIMNQAELEFRIGEPKTAETLSREVLEMENATELFPDEVRRARTLLVDIAELGDQSGEAAERLQSLIDETEDPVQRSQLRLRLARRCKQRKAIDPEAHTDDEILGIMRDAIRDNPYNIEAMILYSEQCVIAKYYRNADNTSRYILENLNRNNERAKDVMFECALAERRFDDAERIIIDRYEKADPTNPSRYYALARVLMGRGRFEEAGEMLDLMESAAQRGTVLTLLYHGLTESDWVQMTSARRLREHVNALKDAGFIFIAPSEIPKYAGLREGESAIGEVKKQPWLARTIDWTMYQVSGYRRFKPEDVQDFRDQKPKKYVAVTFDGSLRSSLALGTDVAAYLGVPFAMFSDTRPRKDYQPALAGWEELRRHVEAGTWEVGSNLHNAYDSMPVDREGRDIRHNLPNRVWLPAKNRIESMNEWDARMRAEFATSRQIVRDEMGALDGKIPMVAYPYGDIGQETFCNLNALENPMFSIISEASRHYQLGFRQDVSGYTTAGNNLMMCRRYEPRWDEGGQDLVRGAYQSHPVFLARRTKVELAIHMNKPHMAEKNLALLRRDGYPEDLCREIERSVRMHFRNIPAKPERELVSRRDLGDENKNQSDKDNKKAQTATFNPFETGLDSDVAAAPGLAQKTAEREEFTKTAGDDSEIVQSGDVDMSDGDPWVALARPWIAGEVSDSQANDQFNLEHYGVRGGLDLNHNTSLSAEASWTDIRQIVTPRWNAVTNDPNTVVRREFRADKTDYRIRLNHRTADGATLSGSLGVASLNFHNERVDTSWLEDFPGSGIFRPAEDTDEIVGDLGVLWHPRSDVTLRVFYARDFVMSAVKAIIYDSFGGEMSWRPFDPLQVGAKAQYWSYSDDNALFRIEGNGLFDLMPDVGVKVGMEAMTINASDGCDYYWTPYWDQRVLGLLRYQRDYQGYNFNLDFLGGVQREDGRPPRRRQDDGLSSATDWGYVWGFRGKYNHHLTSHLILGLEFSVNALREYVDHSAILTLTLHF